STSVRIRRSMPLRRCSSGDRATRRSGPSTSPATQYGIPQAEYELYAPRSNATISIASPAIRLACEAALIPAASAPMTMIRSVMRSVHPTALFRWFLGSGGTTVTSFLGVSGGLAVAGVGAAAAPVGLG